MIHDQHEKLDVGLLWKLVAELHLLPCGMDCDIISASTILCMQESHMPYHMSMQT